MNLRFPIVLLAAMMAVACSRHDDSTTAPQVPDQAPPTAPTTPAPPPDEVPPQTTAPMPSDTPPPQESPPPGQD